MNYADIPATSVAAGDLDADGLIDLFSGSHGSDPKLLAHVGAAPSPWAGFSSYEVADLDVAARDVTLADLDADGDLDAVSGSDVSTGDEVRAWENLHIVDTADPWSWSTSDDGVWQADNFDLQLHAEDSGSGVHAIEFRLGDHGPWDDTPPYEFAGHKRGWGGGVFTVQFRAIDRAGNVEPVNTRTIAVDRRPPVTTDDHDDAVWSSEDVTVQLSAVDEVSGVRFVRYSLGGGTWQLGNEFTIVAAEDGSNDGVHLVRYYAVDWAGNREYPKTCVVRIDTSAPEILRATATRLPRASGGGPAARVGSAGDAVRVAFIVTDEGSRRVDLVVGIRDAHGRLLDRVKLSDVRVGSLRTLSFTGSSARRAATVRIVAHDQAGFTRGRTLRL